MIIIDNKTSSLPTEIEINFKTDDILSAVM